MNPSSPGTPRICEPESETWTNARWAGDRTNSKAVLAGAFPATATDARRQHHRVGGARRPERTTPDGLIEALTELSSRCRALTARNRELASEVEQVCVERRRLARDLNDGVQNELISLIVGLQLAAGDRHTLPELAGTLSALGARAEAALCAVREIAKGIYPPALAAFGVEQALRPQARQASIDVNVLGRLPRSTDDAEVTAYVSCSEAIQNVAKHAGRVAHATLRLHYDRGVLAACIQDDGRGFDTARTEEHAGLRNIRDRVQTLGGTVELTSNPGRGTVLTLSLPWPPRSP
jgi:signal transduction histidine kinase